MISEKLSTDSRRMLQKGVPQFVGFCRCTPCRQRRGKAPVRRSTGTGRADAPRAGSAEAKVRDSAVWQKGRGCTPCRQRRGKVTSRCAQSAHNSMHPVQAAPRQRTASGCATCPNRDVPRAGSAQRNNNVPPDGSLTTGRHFFTFHPSRIPTVAPSSSVTMYNPAPIFLTDPAWRSRISPTVPMLSVTGAPPRISPAAVV